MTRKRIASRSAFTRKIILFRRLVLRVSRIYVSLTALERVFCDVERILSIWRAYDGSPRDKFSAAAFGRFGGRGHANAISNSSLGGNY